MTVTINCDICGDLCSHADRPVCRFEFGATGEKGERPENLRLDLCPNCQANVREAMYETGDVEWANTSAQGRLLPREAAR